MSKKKIFTGLILLLNIFNLLVLFSALHGPEGDFIASVLIKQTVWICAGWILALIISKINYRIFYDAAYPSYFVIVLFLICVLILGRTQMGAQRWIEFLGITFQPSEIAKIIAMLIIARTFANLSHTIGYRDKGFFEEIIAPFLPASVIFILIFLQPDLGTSLVIVFMYAIMLFANAPRGRNIIIAIVCAFSVIPAGWLVMKPYQKGRVLTFLNPDRDPLGSGYTVIQSKIAIGSGKFLGKGYLAGTQNKFSFVPANHTDFIFAVFAEEWGFLGCVVLMLIFYFLLKMILDSSARAGEPFAANMCIGIFSLFFIHIFVNLAMTMGMLPVVGLPLLFFSYGGSYMLLNFVLVGVYLNILSNER